MEKSNSALTLLRQVRTIDEAYRIVERSTGENFNLFRILGMETAEVKTHSKFLAELLNPKGSHAQGSRFLELFITYINSQQSESNELQGDLLECKIDLSADDSVVEIEKHIGRKTDDEGGRIDIYIKDSHGNVICIENKIYAGEEEGQMLRYDNFAHQHRSSHLFFLTLRGREAQSGGENSKIYPISYEKHIIEWLEFCKKEAVDLPILRETIGQYINLIKKLTHQTTNKKMEKDLQKLILQNSQEAALVADNYRRTLFNISNDIIHQVKEKMKDYIAAEPLNDQWEICRFEAIQSEKNRGVIWLKPKSFNNDWIIGMEDFNPLFAYLNFDKSIFIGVRAEHGNRNYFEQLDENIKADNRGGWNDYKLITNFNDQKVSWNNPMLLSEISDEGRLEQFVQHLVGEFTKYFEKHRDILVDFLKKKAARN